jgi:alanyl-tRNA synthetase
MDSAPGKVIAIIKDGAPVDTLGAGESGTVLTDQSPFYGEAGGQVGDTGTIRSKSTTFTVTDTQKPVEGVIAHHGSVSSGHLSVGDSVDQDVDADRRDSIRLNHTATHMLHSALQTVVGEHVMQKGSMVNAERLRFDFSHHKALSTEELAAIEAMVYAEVLRNQGVETEECAMDDAIEKGAMALFGEKYGDNVRVVDIPGYSTELCGGTHARRTGDIGLFRIIGESSVAAGVRRIEAETGLGAVATLKAQDQVVLSARSLLKTHSAQVPDAIERILEDRKRLSQELEQLKRELARSQSGDLTEQAREADGYRVLAAEVNVDAKTLRDEADRLRDTLGTGVVVLGSREGGAVKLVVAVSKDIAGSKVHAGNLIREIAGMVGGGGGGRPDLAQAGGKNPDALPGALEAVYGLLGA